MLFTSPVDLLPAELVIEIAALADDFLAPFALSGVCSFWRQVLLSSPRVWQLIRLDYKHSLKSSLTQARLCMDRSAPLPFDVELHAESSELVFPLLSPFLTNISRWRRYTLSGIRNESICLSELFPAGVIPSDLNVNFCTKDVADYDDDLDPKATFDQYSPFWPERAVMNIWVSQVFDSPFIQLPFTRLIITERSYTSHVPAQKVLDILAMCPMLEEFSFNGLSSDTPPSSDSFAVVHLPKLKIMKLGSAISAHAIMSSIRCPSLEELYLNQLNVSICALGKEFDSDHLSTGLGLQHLISQSNPPLRRLEMDRSDIRSEDFMFIFDKLLLLEDLLIVASDMSDDVLQRLSPIVDADEVLLPKLKHLELYDCHRISGNIAVDVISSRVRYTDIVSPESTLMEVSFDGCALVTSEHSQVLMKELGERYRDD